MHSMRALTRALALAATLSLLPTIASAQQTVRIAQGVASLSFLPVWGARALNSFATEGLNATVLLSPGGDPTALAALDSGDADLAAVGTETALRAVAKDQPFEIVYNLMSKVTAEMVVAPSFLEKTGVKPGDPLAKRIAALKDATIGVAAVGGTQETAARWLAAKGGLNPKTDIKIAQVGGPAALQAALENKRIDAFVLSPPEGFLATKSGAGTILISLGDEFPLLANQPFLVLVAKKPIDDKAVGTDRQDRARDAGGQRRDGRGSRSGRTGDPEAIFCQSRCRRHRRRGQGDEQWRRRRRHARRTGHAKPVGVFEGGRHQFRKGFRCGYVAERGLDQQFRRARRQEIGDAT
jgi:NitT/TauT family transport system substrate-binding protein